MNKPLSYLLFFAIALSIPNRSLDAQISGNSLTEYQLGNIPGVEPENLSTLYNQLNLQYRQKKLKAMVRMEHFYTNDSIDRDYFKLTQWQVNYRFKKIELTAGHFFETLGRGLLFRSFEIPSSIKEERSFRVRQGFYRDIQGASFKYKGKVFRLKAIYGKPLQNSFPPGNESQRVETIEAVQPEINLWRQNLGAIVMRHSMQGTNNLFSSLYMKGTLPLNLTYYGEYARNLTAGTNPIQFRDEDGYAAYFSLSHSHGNYGSSLELKSYHNFLIGTSITDPPTLVKEHSYKLLNRTTHLIELFDEKGYQFDIFYSFLGDKTLSFNHSLAVNSLHEQFRYMEFFLEYYWPFAGGSDLKLFLDYARDEVFRHKNRYSGGLYYTHVLSKGWSAGIESELQYIESTRANSDPRTNVYLGLVISQSTKLSLSLYYEFTNDPVVADLPNTERREASRHFYGIGASYRPNSNNTFTAFLGERRGGPACMSGICYEVLDFRGLEFRWTTKFNK